MKLKSPALVLLMLFLFGGGFAWGWKAAMARKQAIIQISVVAQEQPYEFHVPAKWFVGEKK